MKKTCTYILLFISTFSYAQKGSITGFVYDKQTGQPMLYTNVFFAGTTLGSVTDQNGYYAITNVEAGEYNLTITFLGYDSLQTKVTILPGEVINKNLYLQQKNVTLNTIEITGESIAQKTDTRVSVIKITPKNINQIPAIGGQADIAQYMQLLPGITASGDQGGQMYIRGGAPIESKMLLDGMILYNPFHSIGLFSVFDNDIIHTVDIYTGGFNAEYGGRISAITDVKTRAGRKDRLGGKIDVSSLTSKILVEGPLSKKKSTEAIPSFIISFKNGYIDKSSEIIYNNFNYEEGLPYQFSDIYSKLSFGSKAGNKIDLFGFRFEDKINYDISKYNWNNTGFGANFLYVPRGATTILEANFAYSKYENDYKDPLQLNHYSQINGFNMGFHFKNIIDKHEISYGLDMIGFKTNFKSYISPITFVDQTNNNSEISMFLKTKFTLGRFITEPGIHFQYYASLSLKRLSPEPRLSMKYNATEWLRFKLAGGYYSQNLISSQSSRDIVNHFYGFISGSEDLPDKYKGEKLTHHQQKAKHAILGSEIDILTKFHLNIEGYFKEYLQLTGINKDKIYPNTEAYLDKPDYLKKDYIVEDGFAKGIDASFKYISKKMQILTSYSISFTQRRNSVSTYFPPFDRRHNLNILGILYFGEQKLWSASLRWNYGSGFPYTKLIGFYPSMTLEEAVSSLYETQIADDYGLAYADYNKARLPAYHRMDASIKRQFILSRKNKPEANVGVTNLYDQKNIYYTSFKTGKKIYQLPFMLNFGINFTF